MSDLFWLTDAQLERLKPFFPLSHCVPRVDDFSAGTGHLVWTYDLGIIRAARPAVVCNDPLCGVTFLKLCQNTSHQQAEIEKHSLVIHTRSA